MSWASISAEDAASFELWQLRTWCLQPHTPWFCTSAGIPLTVSGLERVCHTGLQSKSPLDLKGMNYMAKVASALQASRQWRDVLRPRHSVSQTGRCYRCKSQNLKEKTFFCSKCTCFYDLWSIAANGTIKQVLIAKYSSQNTLWDFALSHCHWNTNKAGTKGNKFKRENQVRVSFIVFMQWVWEFGFRLCWCYSNVYVCVINDRPRFY